MDMDRYSKIEINMDITLNNLACDLLHIDVTDISGETRNDIEHELHMTLLEKDGTPVADSRERLDVGQDKAGDSDSQPNGYCGSCYGAKPKGTCCNTCAAVQDAYKVKGWLFSEWDTIEQCKREGFGEKHRLQHERGCRIDGTIKVNKVRGQFHIAPGRNVRFLMGGTTHDLDEFIQEQKVDLSHHITSLSFGMPHPEKRDPLDGVTKRFTVPQGSMIYDYYISVVPTVFSTPSTQISTNQFSVTEHDAEVKGANVREYKQQPGLFFTYEFSPFIVSSVKRSKSWTEVFTSLCAIIGGSFTVAGLIDSLADRTLKATSH